MTSKFIYKVIRIKAGFVVIIIHPNCCKTGKQIYLLYLMAMVLEHSQSDLIFYYCEHWEHFLMN